MNPPRVFLLCLGLVMAFIATARGADPENPDSPLVTRAKAHIKTFDSRRSAEENVLWKARALALADSLEAAGEYGLVSHCRERAGIIDYFAGDLDATIVQFELGLAAARKSEDPKRIAALLNAKANGISARGDNETALATHFEILELRHQMGDVRGEGVTWYNIAYSQLALYMYPEAVESLRRAIALEREAGYRHGMAVSFQALAPRLESYIRFEEALAVADSAVAASLDVDSPQFLGPALSTRGDMHHRHGRDELAMADFDLAIEVMTEAGDNKSLGSVLSNRADLLASLNRLDEAAAESERAQPLLTELGDPAHPLIGRAVRGRIHLKAGEFETAEGVLQGVIDDFVAFSDSLDDPVAQAQAREAAGARTYLAFAHARQGRTARAWQEVEAGLAGVLKSEIGLDAPSVSLENFQAALGAMNAAALVYGLGTVEGLPAFLVTPTSLETWEIDWRHGIREAHADVLEMLAAGREGPLLDEKLALLGEMLLPQALPAGIERLVIVPGGFATLPFEALEFRGKELGTGFAVSYAPSATTFVELEGRTVGRGGFLALADPDAADHDSTSTWANDLRGRDNAPLPEAREEVRAISPPSGTTLFGADATVADFLIQAPGASIVHLATHAVVDPANPGTSALVLAGREGANPILLARDIANLTLDADLVCLSSCRTAGGYQVPGEGAFGLTRAFLVAGSRTVVASWWDVEDAASRRFMELFYGGLREGLYRDVAAQRARLVMATEGFSRRDCLAFAVVGAVSGPLDGILGARTGLARFQVATLVLALLMGVLVWRALQARTRLRPEKH